MRPLLIALILSLSTITPGRPALAAVPSTISVHGRLTDASDVPLPPGMKTFEFRLFNADLAGLQLWPSSGSEFQVLTSDAKGRWTARLGAIIPLSDAVFADSVCWLEITVDAITLPRIRLVTGPFAFRVATVDGATGGTIAGKLSIGPGHTNLGENAFVVGTGNAANGDGSVAIGTRARATSDGMYVWADSTDLEFPSSTETSFTPSKNAFLVRATGGVYFVTAVNYENGNSTAGVVLPPGSGAWASLSDSSAKANLAPIDGAMLLARLASIPVQTWNYKAQDASIRHIGPAAQDFYAAFGVGDDNGHISTVDADGVALAAIQELERRTRKIEMLEAELRDLKATLKAIESRMR